MVVGGSVSVWNSRKKKSVALLESGQIWHYPLLFWLVFKFWPVQGI